MGVVNSQRVMVAAVANPRWQPISGAGQLSGRMCTPPTCFFLDDGIAQTTSKSMESVANEEICQQDPTVQQPTTTARKVCECCRKDMLIHAFPSDRRCSDGYRTVCRACNSEGRRRAVAQQPTTGAGKFCTDCWEYKSMIAFARERIRPDGRKYRCRACAGARIRKWRQMLRQMLRRGEVVPPEKKQCPECGQTKPASAFKEDCSYLDCLGRTCIACVAARHQANKQKLRQRNEVEKPEEKICLRCLQTKPASEYSALRSSADGLAGQCKSCRNAKNKAYQQKLRQRDNVEKPEKKTCPDCGETKPASDYFVDRARLDGLQSYCKSCMCARLKKNRARQGNKGRRKKATSGEAA